MRRIRTLAVLLGSALGLLAFSSAAPAAIPVTSTFTYTSNMHPLGFSARANTQSPFTANSDIAFWGKTAYHGNYDGFRIVDVTEHDNPVELNDYRDCAGNQGDVMVWENLLTRTCDGQLVGAGFEGLHIFDVSNPSDPTLVGSVRMSAVLPNKVIVDPPSSAAGEYPASGA